TRSSDLKNFEVVDEEISMNFHPRHGSVLPITTEELERLMEAFPSDNLAEITGASNPVIKSNNIVIDKEEQTIYLPVREGSNLANFDPDFNTLPGVSITPEGAQDFSNGPVSYTVVRGENSKTFEITA